MEYMTRGEYMNALAHALADRDVADADYMSADFKYYFFKQNSLGIGDTEIIQSLPDPGALADQSDGKEYGNRSLLKKTGSAGVFKRFVIGLLSFFAVLMGVITTVISYAAVLIGILAIALSAVYAFHLNAMLPAPILGLVEKVPIGILADSTAGLLAIASGGVFLIVLFATIIKAMHRLRKKYHTWTLKQISGCFRLPVSLDDVYSKGWRTMVYILLPLSMIVSVVCAGMLILGIGFTL